MEGIMPSLSLYAGEDTLVSVGSGLGFFGNNGFNAPVSIGSYNGRTFVTNSSGTVQGFECNNNKYSTASGVIHGQTGSGIDLRNLPNELATINMRFTHDSAIYCQFVKMWIYDGSSTDGVENKEKPATNLSFYTAEIRHRSRLQSIQSTSSDAVWSDLSASGSNVANLVNSPGLNGAREGGPEELSVQHDWYVAMTCTPTQLGDKMFGIFAELEYL